MTDHQPTFKIGITLSGGGARGLAHIGVLQAFEEHGISPEVICGTSAGAIIGAMYAAGYSPEEILRISEKSNIYKLFRLVLPRKGLSSQDYVYKQLQELIPSNSFLDLERKFLVGTTNLNNGTHQVWEEGPLHEVVIASSAIPGIFQPVEIEGVNFVDGGVMNNMPADPIREYCEVLIGSNAVTRVEKSNAELTSLKSILARTFEISLWYRSKLNYTKCDLVIEPLGLHDYHLFNFKKSREIYKLGYYAGLEKVTELKAWQSNTILA